MLRAQAQRRIIQYWQDLMHKYDSAGGNTVELTVLRKRLIFTSNLENIKTILATKFDDFGKGPTFRKQCREFLGDSIFTSDGEQWHRIRQLIRPQFTKDRVSDLKTFENHVDNLMIKITESGEEVELLEFFSR
jgi:cytochrome P450